jgi:hypothetical protein
MQGTMALVNAIESAAGDPNGSSGARTRNGKGYG